VAKELSGTIDTQDVTQIFSTYNSFAALRKDGSVVTWGSAATGGDSTTDKTLAAKLNGDIDVIQIFSTDYAFSALRADGSVVTWGGNARLGFGGDSSTVKDLTGVIGFSDDSELLTGTDKNEKLDGLSGNDTLIGGLGVDTLTGGSGSDTFKFNNVKETGIDAKTRDTITDFKQSEGDKIDLSAIDANSNLADDQTFNFVGSANFTKHAGELHFTKGILEGDTNGDGKADFSIQLNGVTTLVAADFVL
jgi:Ca2+-binding RTX toxin-like protein